MTNNKQQTAVEIIESALDKYFSYEYNKNKATPFVKFDLYESLKQAKEMDKERMIKLIQFVVSEKELVDYSSVSNDTANYYLDKFNQVGDK